MCSIIHNLLYVKATYDTVWGDGYISFPKTCKRKCAQNLTNLYFNHSVWHIMAYFDEKCSIFCITIYGHFLLSLPYIIVWLSPFCQFCQFWNGCLNYRNVTDLFGMLRPNQFQWCQLHWSQTPEKRNFWDFFPFMTF